MKLIRALLRCGHLFMLACAIAMGAAQETRAETEPHLFVVTTDLSRGSSAVLGLESPWPASVDVESTGSMAIVRHFFGKHYVVDRASALVQVIDPATFDTIHTFSVEAGSQPRDIVLVDPRTAYVSRYESTLLYKVNPETGVFLGTVDLSALADDDGLPEMSMMALDRNHLFVQLQRLNRLKAGNPVFPSYLAVVDVTTDTLVDADPSIDGIQGVALQGTIPDLKMHRSSRARRLFVSAPGPKLDTRGGIEEIDLDALRSLGQILPEPESIGDVGAFVMVNPDLGYAVGHTDLTASSHLFMFTRAEGRVTSEIALTFAEIGSMAYDPATSLLYFPTPDGSPPGIHVIDTLTNTVLTRTQVDTGLAPRDLLAARPPTIGDPINLRVEQFDHSTGDLSISYRPACGAADHHVVWGPLQEVGLYPYLRRDCNIGSNGSYEGLNLGEGSYFFIVVGADGVSSEGSYGTDSSWTERPSDLDDLSCALGQDLTFSCDIW